MPQYDLSYDLTDWHWRVVTGSDNDYRIKDTLTNNLEWVRKDALVDGDHVVSYDTDTGNISHRAIFIETYTQIAKRDNNTQSGQSQVIGAASTEGGNFSGGNYGTAYIAANGSNTGAFPTSTSSTVYRFRYVGTLSNGKVNPFVLGTISILSNNNGYVSFRIGTSAEWAAKFGNMYDSKIAENTGDWILEERGSFMEVARWAVGEDTTAGSAEWDDGAGLATYTTVGNWNIGNATTNGQGYWQRSSSSVTGYVNVATWNQGNSATSGRSAFSEIDGEGGFQYAGLRYNNTPASGSTSGLNSGNYRVIRSGGGLPTKTFTGQLTIASNILRANVQDVAARVGFRDAFGYANDLNGNGSGNTSATFTGAYSGGLFDGPGSGRIINNFLEGYHSTAGGGIPGVTSQLYRLRYRGAQLPAGVTGSLIGAVTHLSTFTIFTGLGNSVVGTRFRIGTASQMQAAFGANFTPTDGQFIIERVTTTADSTVLPGVVWTLQRSETITFPSTSNRIVINDTPASGSHPNGPSGVYRVRITGNSVINSNSSLSGVYVGTLTQPLQFSNPSRSAYGGPVG